MEKKTVANIVFQFLAHVTIGMSASITGIVEPRLSLPRGSFPEVGITQEAFLVALTFALVAATECVR